MVWLSHSQFSHLSILYLLDCVPCSLRIAWNLFHLWCASWSFITSTRSTMQCIYFSVKFRLVSFERDSQLLSLFPSRCCSFNEMPLVNSLLLPCRSLRSCHKHTRASEDLESIPSSNSLYTTLFHSRVFMSLPPHVIHTAPKQPLCCSSESRRAQPV